MEDIAVTAFMIGALTNGIPDPINMDQTQIDQVKQFLIDHKSQFRTFWKGDAEIKSQFKSGEIVIVRATRHAKALHKEGVNAKFAVANEGQILWTCGYGISPDVAPRTSTQRTRCSTGTRAPRRSSTRPSTGTTRWRTPRCWTWPRPS